MNGDNGRENNKTKRTVLKMLGETKLAILVEETKLIGKNETKFFLEGSRFNICEREPRTVVLVFRSSF